MKIFNFILAKITTYKGSAKNWVLGVFLLVFSFSCQQNEDLTTKSYAISIENARLIAANFSPNYPNTKYRVEQKNIKDEFIFKEKDQNYMYLFNFEEGGFLIMSADERNIPILAYSEINYFDIRKVNAGFVAWAKKNKADLDDILAKKLAPHPSAEKEWKKLKKENNIISYVLPEDPNSCTYETRVVNPLLQTTWSQTCGYNDYCPQLGCNIGCGNGTAYTGCVATAIAQVAKYWNYPANFNWAAMPTNSGSPAVAELMANAGYLVLAEYGCGSTSANSKNVPNVFSIWGYSSKGNYVSYSYNTLQSELFNYRRPAMLTACAVENTFLGIPYSWSECHLWVCDGIQVSTFQDCFSYAYLHMNWGWGGYSDGWFSYNNWGKYKYNIDMIINVNP